MTLYDVHYPVQTIAVEANDEAEAHYVSQQRCEPDDIREVGKWNVRGVIVTLILFALAWGGLWGVIDSVSANNVWAGICSGIMLGLIPMGWNELMAFRRVDGCRVKRYLNHNSSKHL